MADALNVGHVLKFDNTAPYFINRTSATHHPQGSNIYSPGIGVKLIQITIAGHDWLDPSTCRIMFNLP